MKVLALENTKVTVRELARMAKHGPVILTRKGKPVASFNDISRADWESISLANNPRFQAIIEESRHGFRASGGTRLESLRAEMRLAAKARTKRKRSR